MRKPSQVLGAFTLLEVMVAVAILAVALSAIFSSEVGAIRVAARARFTTTATLLARCKMAEIEEQVLREGLPAVSATGVDGCCEDGEVEGFECEWEISRIVLPDQMSLADDEAAGLGGGTEGGGDGATTTPSVDQIMSGAMMGGGDVVAEMALQYAFPILKPHLEEQVRRARVTVRWREGDEQQSFDVVQFLVQEQAPAALTQEAARQAIEGTSGAGAGTGAGAGGMPNLGGGSGIGAGGGNNPLGGGRAQ